MSQRSENNGSGVVTPLTTNRCVESIVGCTVMKTYGHFKRIDVGGTKGVIQKWVQTIGLSNLEPFYSVFRKELSGSQIPFSLCVQNPRSLLPRNGSEVGPLRREEVGTSPVVPCFVLKNRFLRYNQRFYCCCFMVSDIFRFWFYYRPKQRRFGREERTSTVGRTTLECTYSK